MKKFASMVAAGALLLSSATAVFAGPVWGTTQGNYGTHTAVVSVAVSNSGLNSQMGKGFQMMTTGHAYSGSEVMSVANQNGSNGWGQVSQGNFGTQTLVVSGALSNSGLNKQFGMSSHHSAQVMHAGDAESLSGISSWANINLNGVALD